MRGELCAAFGIPRLARFFSQSEVNCSRIFGVAADPDDGTDFIGGRMTASNAGLYQDGRNSAEDAGPSGKGAPDPSEAATPVRASNVAADGDCSFADKAVAPPDVTGIQAKTCTDAPAKAPAPVAPETLEGRKHFEPEEHHASPRHSEPARLVDLSRLREHTGEVGAKQDDRKYPHVSDPFPGTSRPTTRLSIGLRPSGYLENNTGDDGGFRGAGGKSALQDWSIVLKADRDEFAHSVQQGKEARKQQRRSGEDYTFVRRLSRWLIAVAVAFAVYTLVMFVVGNEETNDAPEVFVQTARDFEREVNLVIGLEPGSDALSSPVQDAVKRLTPIAALLEERAAAAEIAESSLYMQTVEHIMVLLENARQAGTRGDDAAVRVTLAQVEALHTRLVVQLAQL